VLESDLSKEIHALASKRFGVRRHWHKRVVRCGENTLLTYHAEPPDRRVAEDDVVYLDFGPLFCEWEADFGRTYVLGADPRKHQVVHDIAAAFRKGKQRFLADPDLTAGSLYDYVCELAAAAGWEFGARTAGHLIGQFPHESNAGQAGRFSIRHGNPLNLRERDTAGAARYWILEIPFRGSSTCVRRILRGTADNRPRLTHECLQSGCRLGVLRGRPNPQKRRASC
jgi:Xaa-Pro aminopeptidase